MLLVYFRIGREMVDGMKRFLYKSEEFELDFEYLVKFGVRVYIYNFIVIGIGGRG